MTDVVEQLGEDAVKAVSETEHAASLGDTAYEAIGSSTADTKTGSKAAPTSMVSHTYGAISADK